MCLIWIKLKSRQQSILSI